MRRSLLAVAFLLSLLFLAPPADSRTPARDWTVVGSIRMGVTTTARLSRIFGPGIMSIGQHSDSAIEWRLTGGGCFTADGWYSGDDAGGVSYVVDSLSWTRGRCKSGHAVALTFHGIRLGERQAKVVGTLGRDYHIVKAYSRPCYKWHVTPRNARHPLNVYASFTRGRLTFLDVDLLDY